MAIQLDPQEQGNGFASSGMGQMISDINVTPFVDVVLVLLIVFMITAPFAVSGVNVQLPSHKAKPLQLPQGADPMVLSISEGGQFFLGKKQVNSRELILKLRTARGADKNFPLYIRADKGVAYGRVMEAMSAAQSAGIFKIGMMSESNDGTKK